MSRRKQSASFADHQRALEQACRDLPYVLALHGDEAFLRSRAQERLLQAFGRAHPGLQIQNIDGRDQGTDLRQVVRELAAGSLFATEKLVILRRADRLLFGSGKKAETSSRKTKGRTAEDALVDFVERPADSTWLLVELERLDQRRRLGKMLKAKAAIVPCPALGKAQAVAAWIRAEAERLGKRVEDRAVDLLFTAHGGNLGSLHAELTKLAVYVGDREVITLEDARTFFSGSTEFDVFGLTNAVEARDLSTALTWARRINRQGLRDASGRRNDGDGSVHMAMAMLARSFTSILRARMLGGGKTDRAAIAEIAKGMSLASSWRAGHLATAAAGYPVSELRRLIRILAREMRSLHHTDADPALSLERVVLAACNRRRGAGSG